MSRLVATKPLIRFILDGKEVQGSPGETIIQVADRCGVYIPRFCYHERLSIAANCRMCLVQVNQGSKTQPACHFPIAEGMEVRTRSKATKHSQKAVMEFLLINHPLDCPICDQGGQCDLQDIAMAFGRGVSRYHERKRAVVDENLGSLVQTDMTRCIHCSRCVRFGVEIAGIPELGLVSRGEDMRIRSYLQHALRSELSGNVVDLCPVGALTAKPIRYSGRSWSFDNHAYYSAHDCLLSHVNVHTSSNIEASETAVMRVVPRLCDAINQVWLSDRDRFSFLGLHHQERLSTPMIKDGKNWKSVEWDVALALVAEKIQSALKDYGPEQIGALISPNTTIEEAFLCQKLLHALGCYNMDYRHHQVDTDYMDNVADDHLCRFLDFSELETSDVVMLVGSYIRNEQPIAAMRIRQAAQKGAKVMSVNPVAYDWSFDCAAEEVVQGQEMVSFLASCVFSLQVLVGCRLSDSWRKLLAGFGRTKKSDKFAKILFRSSGYVVLGTYAQSHRQASVLHQLCLIIEFMTEIKLVHLTPGTNSMGLQSIGFGPCHRFDAVNVATGQSGYEMLDLPKKVYLLQQVELEYDHYDPQMAVSALEKAQTVVAITSFVSERMLAYADVLLPAAAWTEFSGTWVSTCGEVCSFSAISQLFGESKSVWKIYRVLGNLLKCKGFSYHDITQLRDDISLLRDGLMTDVTKIQKNTVAAPAKRKFAHAQDKSVLYRIGDVHFYREDPLVRRSQPLQVGLDTVVAKIHPDTVIDARIKDGDFVVLRQGRSELRCRLMMDKLIAVGGVYLPSGLEQTAHMAGKSSTIEVVYCDEGNH